MRRRLPANVAFTAGIGVGLAAGYCLLGAGWLIAKSEGELQRRALAWARVSLWLSGLGIATVSLATPLLNPAIFDKWFAIPNVFVLAPLPLVTALLFVGIHRALRRLPAQLARRDERAVWRPFALSVGIFVLAFLGLADSLFPWLVPQRLDIWQSAAAPGSLMFIFVGALVVLPLIVAYTAYTYRVFRGKARKLEY